MISERSAQGYQSPDTAASELTILVRKALARVNLAGPHPYNGPG